MICRLFVLLSLVLLPVCLYAQANKSNSGNPLSDLNPTEPGGKFSQSPVEITSEGETRYEGGVDTYLQVVTWQTAALNNQRNDLDIMQRRLDASVLLIKALGGEWDTTKMPHL